MNHFELVQWLKEPTVYFNLIALLRRRGQNKGHDINLQFPIDCMLCVFLICAMRMKKAIENVIYYEHYMIILIIIQYQLVLSFVLLK